MGDWNIVGIVGLATSIAGLVLAALACALSSWVTSTVLTLNISIGLWKSCVDILDKAVCVDMDASLAPDGQWTNLKIIRACSLIGILLCAPAVAMVFIVVFVKKEKSSLFGTAATFLAFAGGFTMSAFAGFAHKIKNPEYSDYDYGKAFIFDIVAWVVMWIAAGIILLAQVCHHS